MSGFYASPASRGALLVLHDGGDHSHCSPIDCEYGEYESTWTQPASGRVIPCHVVRFLRHGVIVPAYHRLIVIDRPAEGDDPVEVIVPDKQVTIEGNR